MLLLLFLFVNAQAFTFHEALNHLNIYGYLDVSNTTNYEVINETNTRYLNALKDFQEKHKLPVDGTLNSATSALMNKRRCGLSDRKSNYAVYSNKWLNQTVTWYLYRSRNDVNIYILKQAFDVWSRHANINFIESRFNPNILISFGRARHFQSNSFAYCSDSFDGLNGVLAHATIPTSQQIPVEIHFDSDENWNYSIALCNEDQSSLFETAVHEIGHAIGIDHSFNYDAVMYPYYTSKMFNVFPADIHQDDIHAVQHLYGIRNLYPTSVPPPPTS